MTFKNKIRFALLFSTLFGTAARAEYTPPPPASAARPKHVAPHPSISPLLYAEERVFVRPYRDFIVAGGQYFSPEYTYSSAASENLERKAMVCHALSSELMTDLPWQPRRLSRDRWYAVDGAQRSYGKLLLNLKPVGPDRPGDLPGTVAMFCYTQCSKKTGDALKDLLGCKDLPLPAELACAFDLKIAVPAGDAGVALLCPFRYSSRQ